jgi:hypothetical protein
MQAQVNTARRVPWNKGKADRSKATFATQARLVDPNETPDRSRARDLALFNLAIDSKLRGCDVVAMPGGGRRCRRLHRGSRNGPAKENRTACQI